MRGLYRRISTSNKAVSPWRMRPTTSSSVRWLMRSWEYRVSSPIRGSRSVHDPSLSRFRCHGLCHGRRHCMALDKSLKSAQIALRVGLGLAAFLAGLDKFFNLLTTWTVYLNPLATRLVPVSPATFMHAVGAIEMIVGLAILTRWTRLGAYVAMAWLTGIALNLITMGAFFDVAVRDLEMAIAAYTLARLTEAHAARV